jgi:hypothetical protein
MWIWHKDWFADGQPAHAQNVGLTQYVFEDVKEGLLDVRDKNDLEALLRHPSGKYVLHYEAYGVKWVDGKQVDSDAISPADEEPEEPESVEPEPKPKKRGRPRKIR